jgi:hypothetical protein
LEVGHADFNGIEQPRRPAMRAAYTSLFAVALLGQTLHAQETSKMTNHAYVGLWVTSDGHIRHELLQNGRYVEARGARERAYQGRYQITGDHIDYWDDTGFTADGTFLDGVLHHAGMVLHRRSGGAAK